MHRPMSHLWSQVFAQLKHHVRPGETPLDALNACVVDGNKRVRAWKRDPTDGLEAIVIG